jgi:hypothetical protein
MAFLRKQEAAGKISLYLQHFPGTGKHNLEASTSIAHHFPFPPPDTHHQPGFVYIEQIPEPSTKIPLPNLNPGQQSLEPPKPHIHNTNQTTVNHTQFNPNHHQLCLSIARPKLDLSTFSGDEPINWR